MKDDDLIIILIESDGSPVLTGLVEVKSFSFRSEQFAFLCKFVVEK